MVSGTCNHEVAFRHLRASSSSSTCLLYQFPFEYVTLKDEQAYVGGVTYVNQRRLYNDMLAAPSQANISLLNIHSGYIRVN